MTSPYAIECHGLTAGYEKLTVLRSVDLAVGPKQVMAVLGPNGAGKSTLLLSLAGFLPLTAGTVLIDGTPAPVGSARRMNRAGVVLVPDSRALFTGLTPLQNLALAAGSRKSRVDEVMDLFPGLGRRAKLRTAALSGGEQQMLAIGRALVQDPKVLLIDEMSMGLAPVVVESLMPLIRRVADESGSAVILVEQHVQLALEIADLVVVLVHGDVAASGTSAEMRRDGATLESAYLGRVTAT